MILHDAFVELRGLRKFAQIIPLHIRALEHHGDLQARDFARGLQRLVQ